jgi:hypothetical protein
MAAHARAMAVLAFAVRQIIFEPFAMFLLFREITVFRSNMAPGR